MEALFYVKDCTIKEFEEGDLQSTLRVYEQVEDFLALGPVPKASMRMVLADLKHSTESGGRFCLIIDSKGNKIGVLDFVPETTKGTAFLSLLMISQDCRRKGIGRAVVIGLERFLSQRYQTQMIQSGVQVNNEPGIAFWRACGFEIEMKAKDVGDGTVAYDMKKILRNDGI